MKKCPYCAEEIQDEAIKCKHCGEMMRAVSALTPAEPGNPTGTIPLKRVGQILLVLGFATILFFLAIYDTSVKVPNTEFMGQSTGGERVNNLGLMQNRQNAIIVGSLLALSGLICILSSSRQPGGHAPDLHNVQLPKWLTPPVLLKIGIVLALLLAVGWYAWMEITEIEKVKQDTVAGDRAYRLKEGP